MSRRTIAVIGLGYVGTPVAVAFARKGFPVIGFDVDSGRIEELQAGRDRTGEIRVEDLKTDALTLTSDPEALKAATFFIVTVPTPIDNALAPDLTAIRAASRTVGRALKRGDIVVYESTVYPGCTEEDCAPILEAESDLKSGIDFTIGYSPERINPGDMTHRFENILKVVSGQDAKTLEIVAEIYGAVVEAGIHRAPSIRVAEAAKVIENTQRDLNIALMNELSLIFNRMNIDTGDVLKAAGTKWNFLGFTPGLVGGHCIGVDPYYLTHKSQQVGYHPQVVLAGRRVNDGMGRHIARECVRLLTRAGRAKPTVTVLGITFKEDVPDVRNSKAADIVDELKSFGIDVQVADPNAAPEAAAHEYGITLTPMNQLKPSDAVIVAVAHRDLRERGWGLIRDLLGSSPGGIVLDVKGFLDRNRVPAGVTLWRL